MKKQVVFRGNNIINIWKAARMKTLQIQGARPKNLLTSEQTIWVALHVTLMLNDCRINGFSTFMSLTGAIVYNSKGLIDERTDAISSSRLILLAVMTRLRVPYRGGIAYGLMRLKNACP